MSEGGHLGCRTHNYLSWRGLERAAVVPVIQARAAPNLSYAAVAKCGWLYDAQSQCGRWFPACQRHAVAPHGAWGVWWLTLFQPPQALGPARRAGGFDVTTSRRRCEGDWRDARRPPTVDMVGAQTPRLARFRQNSSEGATSCQWQLLPLHRVATYCQIYPEVARIGRRS